MNFVSIHADDFGISPDVTWSIWDLVNSNLISGVSVITNGYAFDLASSLLMEKADLDIACHLNVCEGIPLSEVNQVDLLIDSDGLLQMTPSRFYKTILKSSPTKRRALVAQIELEFTNQLSFFRDHLPRKELSIDSHLHMHLLPQLFDPMSRLISKHRVDTVRRINEPNYRHMTSIVDVIGQLRRLFLNWCSARTESWQSPSDARQTLGILDSMRLNTDNVEKMYAFLTNAKPCKYQLICHPGQSAGCEPYWHSRPDFRKVYESSNRKVEQMAIRQFADLLGEA